MTNRFEENGWSYTIVEKKTESGLFNKAMFQEEWDCATEAGKSFRLRVYAKQGDNARFTVTLPDDNKADKTEVTSQIYKWLEDIVTGHS